MPIGTISDINYLGKALSLLESLRSVSYGNKVWLLALDKSTVDAMKTLNLTNVEVVSLESLEKFFPELSEAKANRSLIEYYFTLSSHWASYLMSHSDPDEWVVYLDSDLFFYETPERVLDLLKDASVGIVSHRFPPSQRFREKYGVFNVGWVSFKNDVRGKQVLSDWKAKCLDWCYDEVEEGRYADQKYLDAWPTSEAVKVVDHEGVNVAPWNLETHLIEKSSESTFTVNGLPLIFFHFQGVRRVYPRVYEVNFERYSIAFTKPLEDLYRGYIKTVRKKERLVRRLGYSGNRSSGLFRGDYSIRKGNLFGHLRLIKNRCFKYKNWICC